jgi:hypothetical protein
MLAQSKPASPQMAADRHKEAPDMNILIALAGVACLTTLCAAHSEAAPSFAAELEAMRMHGLITTDQLSGNVVWHPFAVSGPMCRDTDWTAGEAE